MKTRTECDCPLTVGCTRQNGHHGICWTAADLAAQRASLSGACPLLDACEKRVGHSGGCSPIAPKDYRSSGDEPVVLPDPTGTTGQQIDPAGVNHPAHYNSDPSGVECIQVVRHRTFNVGNAMKYLWRAGLKVELGGDPAEKQIQDLKKAAWYIQDEIERLETEATKEDTQ